MATRFRVTDDQRLKMVEAYRLGLSQEQSGRSVGLRREHCRWALAQAGVQCRTPSEGLRRHALNVDYFATIDTEEKAYWLGFLLADGNVYGPTVSLGLKTADRYHVEAFGRAIGSDAEVLDKANDAGYGSGSHFLSCLRVHSVKMAADLAALGVTPRKSLTAKPWDGPEGLLRHYWRGVVDGDGCLQNRERQLTVDLTGSRWVVSAFADFVAQHTGNVKAARLVENSKPEYHGQTFRVIYGGVRTPKEIARLLYEGATVFLRRKKELADGFQERDPLFKDWSHLTRAGLEEMHQRLGLWSAVAETLGMTGPVMYSVRRRLGIPSAYVSPHGERFDWSAVTKEHLDEARGRLGSWSAVAEELGITQNKLFSSLTRKGAQRRATRAKRDWSDLDQTALADMRRRLGSWQAVAAELGATVADLCQARKRHGLPRRRINSLAHLTREDLQALLDRNGSWAQVAGFLGVQDSTLAAHRGKFDFPKRRYHTITGPELQALYESLRSWDAVAARLNTSRSQLKRMRRRFS